MKKIAAALLLSSAVAAPAFAADEGFYAGVTLGRTNTGNIASNTTMTKSNDTAFGILGGYQYNKNLAVEAQYTDLGKFSATMAGPVNFNGKANALSLAAVGILPLNDSFSLYGKLGFASTKTTLSSTPVTTNTGATRTAATIGLGGTYNVNQSIGIRFGWDRYGAAVMTGLGVKNHFNENAYSVGAVFKF